MSDVGFGMIITDDKIRDRHEKEKDIRDCMEAGRQAGGRQATLMLRAGRQAGRVRVLFYPDS
jgi:hypothetical protein